MTWSLKHYGYIFTKGTRSFLLVFCLHLSLVRLFLLHHTLSYLGVSFQHLLLRCSPPLWFVFSKNTLASLDMLCFAPLCELPEGALKVNGWLHLWSSLGSLLEKSAKEYKQGSNVSGL